MILSVEKNFKTFQVYSSWESEVNIKTFSFISKLFKFIVHLKKKGKTL